MLGETFNGEFEDGTQFYAEQTCHRPPISHFMMVGPQDRFVYTGYGNFAAHTSMNSITVDVTGGRKIVFDDGQSISLCNSTVLLFCLKYPKIGIFR